MWELFFSAFTTVYGLGNVALAIGAIVCLVYARHLFSYVLMAALACGAIGYIDKLVTDLDAAEAQVATLEERFREAEELAVDNAEKARQLSRQQGIDAAAGDRRLAEARAEAEKRLSAREAIARIEGADSVVCGAPGATGRPRAAAVPPAIDAALDALAPAAGRRR